MVRQTKNKGLSKEDDNDSPADDKMEESDGGEHNCLEIRLC